MGMLKQGGKRGRFPESKPITSLFSVSLSLLLPSPFPPFLCLHTVYMKHHPPLTTHHILLASSTFITSHSMAALYFEDLLPLIAHKLGVQGLLTELSNGFQLLMDKHTRLITFDSLRTNSALLGLHDVTNDDLVCMISEADLDGDGALSLFEFCVLMFTLSPLLMQYPSFSNPIIVTEFQAPH